MNASHADAAILVGSPLLAPPVSSSPPFRSGATALQAVLVNSTVTHLDWEYIGFVTVTASVMTTIALLVNNLPRKRIYPKYWF